MSSGSSWVESAVEPTRSQNMTVSWRRSADAATGVIGEVVANSGASRVVGALAVRGLPHSAQNLAFGRFALPQEGQRASSAAPQAMQNLPVSGVSEWQFGHSKSAPYPTSRVYCFRVILARQASAPQGRLNPITSNRRHSGQESSGSRSTARSTSFQCRFEFAGSSGSSAQRDIRHLRRHRSDART